MMIDVTDLTPTSLKLFKDLLEDAPNWAGSPLLDGNVSFDKHLRGNLTQLKRAGLVTTMNDGQDTWVDFTEKGERVGMELWGLEK